MNGRCDFCPDTAVAFRAGIGGGADWEMCAAHVSADERIGHGVVWQKPHAHTLPTHEGGGTALARTVKGEETT